MGGFGGRKLKELFSAREIRAILLMLPLVVVLVWIVSIAVRPRFDDSAMVLGDVMASESKGAFMAPVAPVVAAEQELFAFDPNEVTYEELRQLGVSKNTAAGIIRYRKRGKVFRIVEDFATCYGVSDSMYGALKPYIIIGSHYEVSSKDAEKLQFPAEVKVRGVEIKKFGAIDINKLSTQGFVEIGFSAKQAAVIIKYRNSIGRFKSIEDFARCYVVSEAMFARLKDNIVILGESAAEIVRHEGDLISELDCGRTQRTVVKKGALVELNRADSADLVSIAGIGVKTANAIIVYRERLGGYYDIAQICDLKVVTERNWELIRQQICVDSCAIKKIDVNFVAPNTVAKHPYVESKTLRKLLHNRQLKGGWSKIEDMLNDNTLTAEEAKKLAPYLQFRTISQ